MIPARPNNLLCNMGTGFDSRIGLCLDKSRHFDLDLISAETIDAPSRIPAGSTEAAGMVGGKMRGTISWVPR